jgi:hypothetical protein
MKKRKRHGNTPGRKRLNRKGRLCKAKEWISIYGGNNIIKAYAHWFGVDWLCALQELKLCGVHISNEEEQKIMLGYDHRIRQKRRQKELRKEKLSAEKSTENEVEAFPFDIVIGYTSGGAPYGVRFEDEVEREEAEARNKRKIDHADNRLPF